MSPVDAFWHIANFLAPALMVGTLAALLSKLLWRRSLGHVGWWRLARCASFVAVLVLVAGLVVFGRDGKMATYGAMVVGAALALWWIGFARGGR